MPASINSNEKNSRDQTRQHPVLIVIFRIESGRIAEAWEVYDEAGMWRQLGVTPPMLA